MTEAESILKILEGLLKYKPAPKREMMRKEILTMMIEGAPDNDLSKETLEVLKKELSKTL